MTSRRQEELKAVEKRYRDNGTLESADIEWLIGMTSVAGNLVISAKKKLDEAKIEKLALEIEIEDLKRRLEC